MRKHLIRLAIVACSLVTGALIGSAALQAAEKAKAVIKFVDGKEVGTIELLEIPAGVLLTAKFKGLPAGTHAIHIHAVGKCEPPFKSAGGHFNPEKTKHGLMAEEGLHSGDMPNIHVAENGTSTVEIWNPMVNLFPEEEGSLRDSDGSAIVIHQRPDDYKTDPAGAAGARIACGVIK